MSSSCLFGPSFSINAETYYSSNDVEFSVVFEAPESLSSILTYEWYLDNLLVIDKNDQVFSSSLSCGSHKVSVRILTAEGWSGLVSHSFSTCRLPVSLTISGPESVQEGSTATYKVLRTFSDGYAEDVTADYEFQSTVGGSFSGNVFSADRDDNDYNDKQVTISVKEDGEIKATKNVTVVNTTTVSLAFIKINGPSTVNEGASGVYSVIATYSNGTETDVSAQYSFIASEGSFSGQTYTATANSVPGDSRQVRIDAIQQGMVKATKQIIVADNSLGAGVLVVDFYDNSSLNIIGFIENSEIQFNHSPASAQVNIIPDATLPAQALILASDLNPSGSTNWRFEFNLARLISENPGVNDFAFSINGRGTAAGIIAGAFSLRSNDAVMTMNDLGGNLMPSVSGGTNIGGLINFSGNISSGANGSYLESDLPLIIRFNYNVSSKSLTYSFASNPVAINYNLQRNPPPPYVDANFSLQKNGSTTDLVTVTGTGFATGNYQIGDTLTVNLFHYLSARWPDDGEMILNIKNASGIVLYNYQGGARDIADVHSYSFTLTEQTYLIEVLSSSNDTTLSTPGYTLSTLRSDIVDSEIIISITDSTTDLVMLGNFPMPPSGTIRKGAYNVKNDNGVQKIQIENNSPYEVSIKLSSDHGFNETFNLEPANGILKTVTDKSGITMVINQAEDNT